MQRRRSRFRRPAATIDFDALVALLFPDGVDAPARTRLTAIWEASGAAQGAAVDASLVRRLLGALDRQVAPSPFGVRFGSDDLVEVEVATVGEPVRVLLDEADASVSVQIRDEGFYEPYLTAVLDSLLQPGDVFIDIGANIGYHSLRAARSVGATGRVVAVEANTENARVIALAAVANGFDNLEVLPLALGDRRGFVPFGSHIGSNGGFVGAAEIAPRLASASIVPVVRLDDLGLERVDVIKIDVEGAESLVLAGADTVLRELRPVVIAEFQWEMTVRVGGVQPIEYLEHICSLGYDLYRIDRTAFRPVRCGSPREFLQDWGDPGRLEDVMFAPVSLRSSP